MRIGFLTERMLTGFGVDLAVDQLAAGLSRRGHDVTVYCSMVDDSYSHRQYRLCPTPVQATKAFPLMDRRGRAWATVLDYEDLDVLEVHSFPFFSTIPRLSVPTVAVDHGISLTQGMPMWLRADFAYVSWSLYHRDLPHASEVVTISDFLRKQMPTRLAARAHVIPWGAEHYWRPVGREESVAYRRNRDIPDDAILALYVGRLNHKGQPYKGVAELLRHFQALRHEGLPVALLCVGFGGADDAATIARAGGVAVLSAPASEMPLAYSAADLFVTCSRWEGFGLPLIEAQRFGRPAVAYAVGAHPEIANAGESALLVRTPEEFRSAWRSLVTDAARRKALAEAASQHAANFSWDRAVTAHEDLLRSVVRPSSKGTRAAHDDSAEPLVSAVVLTYEPEQAHLQACLHSLLASTYPRLEVVVVDNGSRNGVADAMAAEQPRVTFVPMGHNAGFSAGINRGIAESSGSLVFLLNPDAHVEPDTIALLVDAACRRSRAVGFAPKMVFAHDPDLIDAVGTGIDSSGAAFNRGIGQLDIGQYDIEEPVMGCCFGAALLRREAFNDRRVGPLDEVYFLYYEDVDWCLRATQLGEDFWTVPSARVHHVHSASSRDHAYAFKYRLIQRNLYYTVFKNFEKRRMAKIFLTRTKSHVRNAVFGPRFRKASVQVMWEAWTGALRYRRTRSVQQKRRVRCDLDAIKLSDGEVPFFDPVEYAPEYKWETLIAMLRRRYVITGEEHLERAIAYLDAVTRTSVRFRPREVERRLADIAGPLPGPVLRFLNAMGQQPGMMLLPVEETPEGSHVRSA